VQLLQWLGGPVFADGSRDTLDQFLTTDLFSAGLTLREVMAIHQSYISLFTLARITHLQGLQDRTKISHNHYNALPPSPR
jgi:hypothetical protein